MAISKLSLTSTALAVIMSVSLAGTANAAKGGNKPGNKQGPQAGIAATTSCALSGDGYLTVSIDVADKTSGEAISWVDGYQIQPVKKVRGVKGNEKIDFYPASLPYALETPVEVGAGVSIQRTFDLCSVSPIAGLQGINAETTVDYYGELGGVKTNEGTVNNKCTDNPDTLDVDEGGIKINEAELAEMCSTRSTRTP